MTDRAAYTHEQGAKLDRVWESTAAKDAAMKHWCERVTVATDKSWRYARVDQVSFHPAKYSSIAEMLDGPVALTILWSGHVYSDAIFGPVEEREPIRDLFPAFYVDLGTVGRGEEGVPSGEWDR
jgi:hypothetical protein